MLLIRTMKTVYHDKFGKLVIDDDLVSSISKAAEEVEQSAKKASWDTCRDIDFPSLEYASIEVEARKDEEEQKDSIKISVQLLVPSNDNEPEDYWEGNIKYDSIDCGMPQEARAYFDTNYVRFIVDVGWNLPDLTLVEQAHWKDLAKELSNYVPTHIERCIEVDRDFFRQDQNSKRSFMTKLCNSIEI